MTSRTNPLARTRWLHHRVGRVAALVFLLILVGTQAGLAEHSARHRSCSADTGQGPHECSVCAAAANFTATMTLGVLPGDAAFCGFLTPPSRPRLPDAQAVPRSARGPPFPVV